MCVKSINCSQTFIFLLSPALEHNPQKKKKKKKTGKTQTCKNYSGLNCRISFRFKCGLFLPYNLFLDSIIVYLILQDDRRLALYILCRVLQKGFYKVRGILHHLSQCLQLNLESNSSLSIGKD